MCRKEENSGFTIVELLIAVTILSIVIVTVCGFIVVGSRSYAAGNSDINVQQEAQLALNQMSDVLIDTTRSVTYSGYDAGGNVEKALKDAEFSFSPEDKRLLILNGVVESVNVGGTETKKLQEGNGNKHYCFHWSKEQETLYYAEVAREEDVVDSTAIAGLIPAFDTTDPDFDAGAAGWVVLAGHVTDFSVDLTQVEEKRVVQLALTFLDGNKEYVTSNNVTIRNKVAVNDAELDPLNKKKTLEVTPRDAGVILEPSETYHFSTPKVTGVNVTDRSVVWSLATPGGNSPTGATAFTDAANGVLQVAMDEPAGTLDVVITTNAVDSDGNHATCTLTVSIKRVSAVTLTKTADEDAANGANEISVGNAFTIGATIEGVKIGAQCSGCTLDITHDHHAVDWRWSLVSGTGSLEVIDSADCQPSRYRAAAGTTVGTKFKIEATSELSKNRPYPNVDGAIILTVRQAADDAEPFGGKLEYGDETIVDEIREELSTEGHEYAVCVRVVDKSTVDKQPDKILLYYSIDGGANIRIVPDLFDLDLNRDYTFYMQALDPVSKESHKKGDHHTADSNAEIWSEYINNLNSNRPYGYQGTKYDHGKVYWADLKRPTATWSYKGKDYTKEDITFDPVSIIDMKKGDVFLYKGNVVPYACTNIWYIDRLKQRMTYSVYMGEGNDRSGWTPLYWYDGEEMSYKGSLTVGENETGKLGIEDHPGDPSEHVFKWEKNDGLSYAMSLCGTYHIVPGFCYENISDRTLGDHYKIIGWRGFSCDGQSEFSLPHDLTYYEFEPTLHLSIVSGGNLELWSYYNNEFTKGKIHFPTPSENDFTSYFNREVLEWQDAKKNGWFTKLVNDSNKTTAYESSLMKCCYVADKKVYQLELFYRYYDSAWGKTSEVSAGVFQCAADGDSWERFEGGTLDGQLESGNLKPQLDGSTANVDFEMEGQQYKGKMYIPLPSEEAFGNSLGFKLKQSTEQSVEWKDLKYQPRGETNVKNVGVRRISCTYNSATDEYTLTIYIYKDWPDYVYEPVVSFTCKSNGTQWTQQ
ncbi:MAG: prepilin-type N-terminal cleavage/methylation domain-containing protein [Bacteroidales bacterium]|nr:prepilin-type N-terminal cleavage/methylation domain-containing protein [Bacteroidales bacterium]MCM1415127.1 prepilin-type N-terminal cleavage/methylation domain-containing protein [bacterium]MCM1423037.1 prepilin-type N-terminal cleavage/methylation domain-containing protein [bacterium]